jgi:hypothetical protein
MDFAGKSGRLSLVAWLWFERKKGLKRSAWRARLPGIEEIRL